MTIALVHYECQTCNRRFNGAIRAAIHGYLNKDHEVIEVIDKEWLKPRNPIIKEVIT